MPGTPPDDVLDPEVDDVPKPEVEAPAVDVVPVTSPPDEDGPPPEYPPAPTALAAVCAPGAAD